ncbi:MAG: hypothetical protein K8I30_24965 [Anaerolineae bacterium]|nr:hypothetical protein [Anaerolineae bacterium]
MQIITRLIMIMLLLAGLFVSAALIAAQEAEATAEVVTEAAAGEAESVIIESEAEISAPAAGNVPGVSAAMLFLGAGAIVTVGLLMIARDNFRGEAE